MAVLTINRGLVTSPNELAKPDGAAEILDNCVIDFDNVVEPRRGFGEFGNKTPDDSVIKQVMTYKGRIIRHYANKISFDSNGEGDFVDFSGTYNELVQRLRIKYFELNSNLYFTTNEGIKKISAKSASDFTSSANYITNAGAVKAVGLESLLLPTVSGFLPSQSKVAYKILWAKKDANGNIVRGVPSSRLVVTNTSKDVNVGESFYVDILDYTLITDGMYFTFDTPTNKYAAWFNMTGTEATPVNPPSNPSLVGRRLIEVKVSGTTPLNNTNVAAKLAESLYEILDIEVGIEVTKVTISNVDGGDVLDADKGDLPVAAATVSKIFDGQTSIGTPANVFLNFIVPQEIRQTNDTSYFYEVYRTAVATVQLGLTLTTLDPGEEFQKVYEGPVLESGTIIPDSIDYEDIVPESFREGGAYLYTNPVSGEGIIQANEIPPIAHDVAVFKGSAFYANTKERHRIQFNMLGVDQYLNLIKYEFGFTDVMSNYIQIVGHSFSENDRVRFYGVTPPEIVQGVNYYVVNVETDRFQIAPTIGSFPLTLTPPTGTCQIYNLSKVSKLYIGNSTTLRTYSFVGVNQIISFYSKKISETVGGTYFDINSAQNRIKYRVWFDRGGSTSPDSDGSVLLRVPLDAYEADTEENAALAFQEAFFDIPDFTVTVLGSKVTLTYNDNGQVEPVIESSTPTGWLYPITEQTGIGENLSDFEVLLSGLSSQALSIEDTARSLEKIINKDPESPVNAFYISGLNDLPGILLLEARTLSEDPFYLGFSHETNTAIFEPTIPVAKLVSSIQPTSTLNLTTTHDYSLGQQVYCFVKDSSITYLSGNRIISSTPSTTSITIQDLSVSSPVTEFEQNVIFSSDVVSDNSVNPNRVYFSKIQQPEAVPLVNYIDIGPKDKAIQRILALRDSLVVLKEDGVYIISGSAAPNFTVRLSDSSALTYAPDTATNLNNLIYVLTSQGVATVSETGVGIISRNIEDKIQQVANAKFNYKLMSWGMSSESDRCYILWLPEKTTDLYATQAFRYNTFTRTWTRWTKPANCGVVNPLDDKIYLGDSSGRPYVLKERKNFERQDYADREIELNIGSNAINGLTYTLSSVAELSTGDVLVQKQYVDINKFNRLLKKLDRDGFSTNPVKYITLKAIAGDSLGIKLQQLEAKLLSDGVSVTVTDGSDGLEDIRDDFNNLIDEINASGSGTNFKDYKKAQDLLYYETLITSVNQRVNTVVVKFSNKFIQGSISAFKGIKSIVQYAPQHFGKPESTKQIPEGTFIFDQNNFWGGSVGYSSDRSYDFQSIEFTAKGPGYWDGYSWASTTFGGEGNEVPVRTLIPRQKSRCRYLHVQFIHINAREAWKLIGVSLEPREVSTRGYR